MLLKMTGNKYNYFVSYISPFIVANAIIIIYFFSNIDIKFGNKAIEKIASIAFDVYIIHAHILIYDNILQGNFSWIGELPSIAIPIIIILCGGLIYFICALIGMVRNELFRILGVNLLILKFSKVIDTRLYLL
jgi:membrane-bound acyltransferase YfiQ involved in biofilm formation